ncbi:hypothetical protein GCM10023152_03080 [Agromyces bauzanensis]|uniref:Uncharacterized protein n=2 Tax=Agromyces bauzanensis TaxID=1308924 RepID=A0A917PFI8_9MICO|nr:hypothetical protein GCM10011372_11470 [Agromyces bauzanensis]
MLASEVSAGTYQPTALENCEGRLTSDRYPQLVRFAEFTLFTEPPTSPTAAPRYLVLQPQNGIPEDTVADFKKRHDEFVVSPFLKQWASGGVARMLPDPDKADPQEIRRTLEQLAAARKNNRTEPGSSERRQWIPEAPADDAELKVAFKTWIARQTDAEVRATMRSLSASIGGEVSPPTARHLLGPDDLHGSMDDLVLPGPYQFGGSRHWPVALFALFEQTWVHKGYTRGELVGSLSLAPGERLTLEVHFWDKSSRKTEEELAADFERRTSEKATQRDALTVAQEMAHQMDSSVKASATIPIPKAPIGLNAQTDTQVRGGLNRTTEKLRERTLEASSTLKLNRKTRIEVSRETGREEKQTRTVENTNRCHTLNCHYFEVVSNYLVTTRLTEVVPCALVRYTRPEFTLDWILCHQHELIPSLLDQTFLVGFEAAKQVKIARTIEDMRAQARLDQLETLGDQILPFVTAVSNAYSALVNALERADDAFEEFGPGSTWAIVERIGDLNKRRLISYFGLQVEARIGLDALVASLAAGGEPVSALRTLLAITPADLPPRDRQVVQRDGA